MLRTIVIIAVTLALGIGGTSWVLTGGASSVRAWIGSTAAAACSHGLAPAACPFCTPALIDKLGTCREHDVAEALCWQCRPALIAAFKAAGDWCGGHDCPESLCKICGGSCASSEPTLPAAKTGASAVGVAAGDSSGDAHATHDGHAHGDDTPGAASQLAQHDHDHTNATPPSVPGTPRNLRTPNPDCHASVASVALASAEIAQRAGLTFATVEERPITQTVTCTAEVEYDASRFAQLRPRVAGVVREVRRDLGEQVGEGEVLALVDSAELASAKAEFLMHRAAIRLIEQNYERERGLADRGVSTARDVLELESKLAEARIAEARAVQRLLGLGLQPEDVRTIDATSDTSALLPLTAPFAGVVVNRAAVIGELVDPSRAMFSVADTARMWVSLDATDVAAPLAVGQRVTLVLDGPAREPRDGRVTWVSTQIDPRTRTLKARAVFDNSDRSLRAHMFGAATVTVREQQPMLVVPKGAVQWDGCCNVVFVRLSATRFDARQVTLAAADGESHAVRAGVSAGETVVVQGSYLLKTEILKAEIGAGCCPDDVAKN
ncbi:MAG: efflux RND transporter periplasmic adaptor subunit [Phycisphaerae bacterium]